MAIFVRPVNARASRTALMHDSVDEHENCTCSIDGMRSMSSSASAASPALGLPCELVERAHPIMLNTGRLADLGAHEVMTAVPAERGSARIRVTVGVDM